MKSSCSFWLQISTFVDIETGFCRTASTRDDGEDIQPPLAWIASKLVNAICLLMFSELENVNKLCTDTTKVVDEIFFTLRGIEITIMFVIVSNKEALTQSDVTVIMKNQDALSSKTEHQFSRVHAGFATVE